MRGTFVAEAVNWSLHCSRGALWAYKRTNGSHGAVVSKASQAGLQPGRRSDTKMSAMEDAANSNAGAGMTPKEVGRFPLARNCDINAPICS